MSDTQIQAAAALVDGISGLDTAPMGANVFVNGVIGPRVSNYGIGVRTAVDLNATINIDNVNVGFADIFTSFTAPGVTLPTTIPPIAINYFSQQQADAMASTLLAANAVSTIGEANAVVIAYDAALATNTGAAGQ